MIGFMVVVPMVVASHITLVWTDPHWWGPFKVGEVPNVGQESIIGDVESCELGVGGGLSSSRIAQRGASGSCLGCFYARTDPWRSVCYYGQLS